MPFPVLQIAHRSGSVGLLSGSRQCPLSPYTSTKINTFTRLFNKKTRHPHSARCTFLRSPEVTPRNHKNSRNQPKPRRLRQHGTCCAPLGLFLSAYMPLQSLQNLPFFCNLKVHRRLPPISGPARKLRKCSAVAPWPNARWHGARAPGESRNDHGYALRPTGLPEHVAHRASERRAGGILIPLATPDAE